MLVVFLFFINQRLKRLKTPAWTGHEFCICISSFTSPFGPVQVLFFVISYWRFSWIHPDPSFSLLPPLTCDFHATTRSSSCRVSLFCSVSISCRLQRFLTSLHRAASEVHSVLFVSGVFPLWGQTIDDETLIHYLNEDDWVSSSTKHHRSPRLSPVFFFFSFLLDLYKDYIEELGFYLILAGELHAFICCRSVQLWWRWWTSIVFFFYIY